MTKLHINILKNKVIEAIKYDYNHLKFPLVVIAFIVIYTNYLLGNKVRAFNIVSSIYRTGWKGSYTLGTYFTQKFFGNKHQVKQMLALEIANIQPLPNTKKFFDHPEKMLDGVITVLKSPANNEKGVLIINYSYYFLMFHKHFNVEDIINEYIIVLEPSWAGFCEASILSYTYLPEKVYLMCYEERDFNFISQLNSNIVPLKIGPSWFVNHTNFQPQNTERDIDIIMVAAWAKFKRHGAFFKAISKLNKTNIIPNIVLVGYPVDMTKQEILDLADYYGVTKWLTIYESITHAEVSNLLNRSKINVLWSKFEGNNRAIIEGMFCNTTVIMREGHNYGEKYDFINEHTGCFANENSLADSVQRTLSTYDKFSPRDYVLNNRSCTKATEVMDTIIGEQESAAGRGWSNNIAIKVNGLHSMEYLDINIRNNFNTDYDFLLKTLKSK